MTEEEAAVEALRAVEGLTYFLWKPEDKRGGELLNHWIRFTRYHPAHAKKKKSQWRELNIPRKPPPPPCEEPGAHLDVAVTDEQRREILAISFNDLSIQNIMKVAGGRNASRKLVQRKLDAAGNMNSHCSFANSEKQIRRRKIAQSLAKAMNFHARIKEANAGIRKAEKDAQAERRLSIAEERKKKIAAEKKAISHDIDDSVRLLKEVDRDVRLITKKNSLRAIAFALGSYIKKTVNMKTIRMKIRELKEANSVRYQKLLDDHTQVEELANSGRGKRKRTGMNNSDYIY